MHHSPSPILPTTKSKSKSMTTASTSAPAAASRFMSRFRVLRAKRLLLYYAKRLRSCPPIAPLKPSSSSTFSSFAIRAVRAAMLILLLFLVAAASVAVQRYVARSRTDDAAIASMIHPGTHVPQNAVLRERLARQVDDRTRNSINLWRRVDVNCPRETDAPSPHLYATGTERCYAIGLPAPAAAGVKPAPGDGAVFWQMNSRALCHSRAPTCLYGAAMNRLVVFEPRGSASCGVVSVRQTHVVPASAAGLNESCAAFRRRHIGSMFGTEEFRDRAEFDAELIKRQKGHDRTNGKTRHVARLWRPERVAIIIPKYPWSFNICHFNRLWNFAVWVVRNLPLFMGAADARGVTHVDILFRSRANYNMPWHQGIKAALLAALHRETGYKVSIGSLRKDPHADVQCFKGHSFWLGREGRIDSFPFLNDSAVWDSAHQLNDSHWPAIPHDALWLRHAVAEHLQLPKVGNFSDTNQTFSSIPVPPRRIALLLRSHKAKRRFTPNGQRWFDSLVEKLADAYGYKVTRVRVSKDTPFREQVRVMQGVGLSIGLHGANLVNTIFQPAAGALFEIFPWHYVRYYYAAGANTGLRYSYHEPIAGADPNCTSITVYCAFRHREAVVYLTEIDRWRVRTRLINAFNYLELLHKTYPGGHIPLVRDGTLYTFGHEIDQHHGT